jgi:hypothetical protein
MHQKINNFRFIHSFIIFILTFPSVFAAENTLSINRISSSLLPDSAQAGCSPSESLWVWGTPKSPQKNGDIYDFINGPGQIYIDHGFIWVLKREYLDSADRSITVEIYSMKNGDSALSLFNDTRMRSLEEKSIKIGDKGIFYNPVPNYIIEYIRNGFYIKISTNDDHSALNVKKIAQIIDKNMKTNLSGNLKKE